MSKKFPKAVISALQKVQENLFIQSGLSLWPIACKQSLPRPDRARIQGPKGPEILVSNTFKTTKIKLFDYFDINISGLFATS